MGRAVGNAAPPRCDFEATFELLGRKHVLPILRSLLEKSPRRFNELQKALHINTATLSERLHGMQKLGIVQREVLHITPRQVEYGLTPMGRDLLKIFRPMMEWRAKYSSVGPSGRPRP